MLKELRNEKEKTAAEVATVLGVDPRAYYRYEQGSRRIGLEQILKLANLYDVSERDVIEAQLNSCQLSQEDNRR
ncbi:MAG: helix-turn-helix transcriptional regulator [Clostridia bacterium]|nr:helix-turn-helix transcriptional regulator [Clostridia bacterium]